MFVQLQSGKTQRRAVAFGRTADMLDEGIEERKLYRWDKVVAKKPNAIFNKDPVEFIIQDGAEWTEIDDNGETAQVYMSIEDVLNEPLGNLINIRGVIFQIEETRVVPEKNLSYRDVYISDGTGTVKVVLWEMEATHFDGNDGDIMQIEKGRIKKYNSVYIQSTLATDICINPQNLDRRVQEQLMAVDINVLNVEENAVNDVGTLDDIRDGQAGHYTITCMLKSTSNDFTYIGCVKQSCRCKLSVVGQQLHCRKCGLQISGNPYFSISLKLDDDTCQPLWVRVFGNVANLMVGMNAEEFVKLTKEARDIKRFAVIEKLVKVSLYKDIETYTNYRVQSVEFVNL